MKADKNIFGKSASEIEKSVKSFLLSLTVPLKKSLLQDFEKISFKHNFKKAVSISTEIVVENIRAFWKNLDFSKNNSNATKVSIVDKNGTLEINLIQNGLIIATELIDFFINSSDIGTKFFFGNQTSLPKLFKSTERPEFQFKDFFIFTSDFFVYVDCVTNDTNAKKALKYLSSHSSATVIKYLKKNLKVPSKNLNLNATQIICSSFENIIPGGYKKCISDSNNIYSCIQYQIPIQSSQQGSKSNEILKKVKKLFSKKWMSDVQTLEPSCKIKDHDFNCNFINKFKNTKHQVKYIIENYIGKQIKTRSYLSKIVNRFSRAVSRSPITKSIVRNCYDYVSIWRAGQKKREILYKISKKNSQMLKEFRKVSKSLYNYQNGVVKQLLNAIIAFNQIPVYLENSLEKSFSNQQKQTLFSSIFSYLSRLIQAVFDRNGKMVNHKSTAEVDYNKNSIGLTEIQEGNS